MCHWVKTRTNSQAQGVSQFEQIDTFLVWFGFTYPGYLSCAQAYAHFFREDTHAHTHTHEHTHTYGDLCTRQRYTELNKSVFSLAYMRI